MARRRLGSRNPLYTWLVPRIVAANTQRKYPILDEDSKTVHSWGRCEGGGWQGGTKELLERGGRWAKERGRGQPSPLPSLWRVASWNICPFPSDTAWTPEFVFLSKFYHLQSLVSTTLTFLRCCLNVFFQHSFISFFSFWSVNAGNGWTGALVRIWSLGSGEQM